MDAEAFLSMDSLHRPAAHIMGRPQACVCVCVYEKDKAETDVVVNQSRTVQFLSLRGYTVPVTTTNMHYCTLGNSESTDIKEEVGDTRWVVRGRCCVMDEP